MYISFNLLKKIWPEFKYVNFESFQNACFSLGIEIESVEIPNVMSNLSIGYVSKVKKMENSDHLNICEVIVNKKTRTIVCGAPNVVKNKFVLVATEETILPNGEKFSHKTIRGTLSEGMLCSYPEITSKQMKPNKLHEGIIILDGLKGIKTQLEELGFNDEIYELSIPYNRPELNSIYYLGMEILNRLNKKYDEWKFKKIKLENEETNGFESNKIGMIRIKTISDYNSNIWLILKSLINSNIKPEFNVMDCVNYFSLIFGIPINVVDPTNIKFPLKYVKLKSPIDFVDEFDNITKLDTNDIVVCDDDNKIILAGNNIVHKNFKFNSNKDILLLVGHEINPEIISTNNKFKLYKFNSNLYNRLFSSEVSSNCLSSLINYWNTLIDDKASIEILNSVEDIKQSKIPIDCEFVNNFLGLNLNKSALIKIFNQLKLKYTESGVNIPKYRLDLNTKYDLCEEIVKIIDINKLEPIAPKTNIIYKFNLNKNFELMNDISDYLTYNGLYESKTYNLVSDKIFDSFNLELFDQINIVNNNSSNRNCLRKNAINSILNVIKSNYLNKNTIKNWFEITNIAQDINNSFNQLNIVICSDYTSCDWSKNLIQNNLLNLKSHLLNIGKKLNTKLSFEPIYNENFISNYCFKVYANESYIGYFGSLNNQFIDQEIRNLGLFNVAVINLDLWISLFDDHKIIKNISSLQPINKDLSLTIDKKNDFINIFLSLKLEFSYLEFSIKDIFEKDNDIVYTITYTYQPVEEEQKNLGKKLDDIHSSLIHFLEQKEVIIKK